MKKNIYITAVIILSSFYGLIAQDVSLTNATMTKPANSQQYGQACFTLIAEEGVSVTTIPMAVEISMSKVQFDATDISGFNSDHFQWSIDPFADNVIRGTLTQSIADIDNGGGGAQICVPVRRSRNRDYRDSRNGFVVNIVPGSLDQGGNSGSDFTSRFGFSNANEVDTDNEKQIVAKSNAEIASESELIPVDVTVYPNPSHDMVRIQALLSGDDYSIQVYDVNGSVKMQNKAFDGQTSMVVSDWAPGMYILEIQNNATGERSMNRLMVAE